MTVCRRQVELAVVVRIEKSDPKAQQEPARHRKADHSGMVDKLISPEVLVKGGGFGVEVRDRQVDSTVAVEVAARDTHPSQVSAFGIGSNPRFSRDFLEPKPSSVLEKKIGRQVVGHKQIDASVIVEVGRGNAESATFAIGFAHARLHDIS